VSINVLVYLREKRHELLAVADAMHTSGAHAMHAMHACLSDSLPHVPMHPCMCVPAHVRERERERERERGGWGVGRGREREKESVYAREREHARTHTHTHTHTHTQRFRRRGDDLLYTCELSRKDVSNGINVTIPTLSANEVNKYWFN